MKTLTSSKVKNHVKRTFSNYTNSSTFHCIKYVGKTNLHFLVRIFFFLAFLTFLTISCTASLFLWAKYDAKPTVVQIEDTNLAFTDVTFPAITICPANRIKKSFAYNYLTGFLNSSEVNNTTLFHVASILSLLQHPTYGYMEYHLKKADKYLYLFDSLNITDFMIETLPSITELMERCYWHGYEKNCSQIFSLQRTEEGFCYSFNSVLSETLVAKNCTAFVPPVMFLQDEVVKYDEKCIPKFTTASGIYSGLTVYLKDGFSKDIIDKNGTSYEEGVVVTISTPYELPGAGTGILFDGHPGNILQIEVKPEVRSSSRKLSNVPADERGCRLRNEKRLRLYDLYTQSTCITECRHRYVEKKCKCQLYFFFDKNSRYPLCTVRKLECIVRHRVALTTKDLSAPNVGVPNCKCTLPCYGILYETVTKIFNMTAINGKAEPGVVDVYFNIHGGIKYIKKMRYNDKAIIVAVGGIGNLFLGASIISVLEFVYYSIRALLICRI